MAHQFPSVIKLLSEIQLCAAADQLFENSQIAVRIICHHFPVCHRSIPVYRLSAARNDFVHSSHPARIPVTPQKPLPVIGKYRAVLFIKGGVIFHHDDRDGRIQAVSVRPERGPVLFRQDIIGIQPHDIFLRRQRKGKISRCCKVIRPLEIIDFIRISGDDLFRPVGRSGIHDDNFIHQIPHGIQTSGDDRLLILYNHAETDTDHLFSLPLFRNSDGGAVIARPAVFAAVRFFLFLPPLLF